jgi:hypothetical protein
VITIKISELRPNTNRDDEKSSPIKLPNKKSPILTTLVIGNKIPRNLEKKKADEKIFIDSQPCYTTYLALDPGRTARSPINKKKVQDLTTNSASLQP